MPAGCFSRAIRGSGRESNTRWAGYYAVAPTNHHEPEYNAIRNAARDRNSPLKYLDGPDALRLVNRVITRDASKMAIGQVYYTPWCDEDGKVIDDGTVTRLSEQTFRWTAADPNLRWLTENSSGLDVAIEDASETVAALALQGPTSALLLREVCDANLSTLKYFRATSGHYCSCPAGGRGPVTRRSGYEIWMPWESPSRSGMRSCRRGRLRLHRRHARLGYRPHRGRVAADRVDFHSSRKALIESQKYTPHELGLGTAVESKKGAFVGRAAIAEEVKRGVARQIVGLEVDWTEVEKLYDAVGLPPTAPAATSRVAVPVYQGRRQIGRATSTTWSSTLKKLIALATIDAPYYTVGTRVEMEMTVEAVRHRATATVCDAVLKSAEKNYRPVPRLPCRDDVARPADVDHQQHAHRQLRDHCRP